MTYLEEFPDFDPAALPAIPTRWTDQSWHNDLCPSFNAGNGHVVFIDFADPTLREFPETPRFTVHADPEIHDHNDVLFESDDWTAILNFVQASTICRKWVGRIGLGFHPDTRGKDYSPKMTDEEIREYDADMETLFAGGGDPYAFAVKAMEEQGLTGRPLANDQPVP